MTVIRGLPERGAALEARVAEMKRLCGAGGTLKDDAVEIQGDHRERLGVKTKGPTKLVTDLCIFEPDPVTKEMTVTSIHPGVSRDA